ncbi:hypothetical protein VA7868_02428 [Vibrio aerogenes CECT 7868]|uniref:DUF6896 domain-containing protein n=1 Tax=Vibrio aerogenes CECT 7868 TaxID=1216006 RepID=A0A1M5Z8H6_9VIBR|nr:hypothetical protein [Vibrio aerogenes]SHI20494.1 hypothetical protein VA7868_02428 [Vibrio aerogenes CECT 7868]
MNTPNTSTCQNQLLLQLINIYIKAVNSSSSTLSSLLKLGDLSDWRSNKIPIQGNLNEGWSYHFHGSGCCIVSPDFEVDFEFDSECQVGGFDVWRLWSFVCDNADVSSDFPEFADMKTIQKSFDSLIENHLIERKAGLYWLVH